MTFITLLAALAPALLLVRYFQSRDAFPEPPKVVRRTFWLGVLSLIPVILLVLVTRALLPPPGNPWLLGLYQAFVEAAIPEELMKFAVLYLYCLKQSAFDEPMDGLVYGATASLGFAALENVLYVANGGLAVAALRAVTAVPGHALLGAVMGYFVALYVFQPERRGLYLTLALAVPMVLHGLYDLPLMLLDTTPGLNPVWALLTLLVLAVEWVVAASLLRRVRVSQLAGGGR